MQSVEDLRTNMISGDDEEDDDGDADIDDDGNLEAPPQSCPSWP